MLAVLRGPCNRTPARHVGECAHPTSDFRNERGGRVDAGASIVHAPVRGGIRLRRLTLTVLAFSGALLASALAEAHGIAGADQAFLLRTTGAHIGPYVYLGAKHMVTGYDHLLFLAGVIFFLYRLKDVAVYVTLFAIGHSTTLLLGVLAGWHVNAYLVDAVIGLSVVFLTPYYLIFRNALLTQPQILSFTWNWLPNPVQLGFEPNTKGAVLFFGFFHGLGLATKLQDLALSRDGLVTNMVSFNVGVEIGQLLALSLILITFNVWRSRGGFLRHAFASNVALMAAGFVLAGYQLTGYVSTT